MSKYKPQGTITLFDKENTEQKLSSLGNPLERLSGVIDFEMFRKDLEDALLNVGKKNNAGAKPYDVVMMFKIIILQRYYNISDEQTEYQINDRMSFKNFLGLASGDKVPDARTIWLFREQLAKKGMAECLFHKFVKHLLGLGYIFNEGQMIDASFVVAPRQRNTREENKKIKNGEGKDLWNDNPNKKRHKDIDARWTKKGDEVYFGYKLHAKADKKSKFVKECVVSAASMHDSKAVAALLDKSDSGQELFADGAYVGQENTLKLYNITDKICEKGCRNHPLTEEQRKSNHEKSKIRSRIEHIFGNMEGPMHGLTVRTIGLVRACNTSFMTCLTYNLFRFEQVMRLGFN